MTAIEIFKTIALVAGILIAPFIIAALVCVLVVALGLIISLLPLISLKRRVVPVSLFITLFPLSVIHITPRFRLRSLLYLSARLFVCPFRAP